MENFEIMEPWNKGKAVGQMTPLKPNHVHAIKTLLENERSLRDLALFSVAIDTMLRSVDLLALKVEDITDSGGKILEEFPVRQQKTGVGHLVALSSGTRHTLKRWIVKSGKVFYDHLFTGLTKGNTSFPISRRQYSRLVKRWVTLARLNPNDYSTHSLRRTKASIVYQATGDIAAIRELLGQKNINSTSAYLNMDKRKALDISKRFEL